MRKLTIIIIILITSSTAYGFDYQLDRYQKKQQQYQQQQLDLQRQQLELQRRQYQQQRIQPVKPYDYTIKGPSFYDSFQEGRRKAQEDELRRQQIEYYRKLNRAY